MRGEFYTLEAKASVAAGTAFPCADLTEKAVQIAGTFVGTLAIEGSVDGSTFTTITAGITTGGRFKIDEQMKLIRINTTAYTSGTPTATLSGKNARTY